MAKYEKITQQNIIDICKTLGDAIRMLRISAQMTQEDLAEAIGVNRQSVFRYETNRTKPSPMHLWLIIDKTNQDRNQVIKETHSLKTMENMVKKYYRKEDVLATS